MKKRMLIMILAVVLVVGGLLGFKLMMSMGAKKFLSTQAQPPQTVSTAKATSEDWQQELQAVGGLRAINGADISSEVAGIVDSISFESGTEVDAGAILVRLRDDDVVAQLKALEAQAHLAQVTVERDLKQLKAEAISQATVDADTAALNSAKAQADAQRALVAKKTIRAPFKGRLGIRKVDVGQYLNPGTAVVTLQQLDPIFVDFNVPEQDVPLISLGQKVSAVADPLPNKAFEGEVTAINSRIDEATRNVQVRAQLKNAEGDLLPGMFAHISIVTGAPVKRVTLPQTAITYNAYGNTVYLAVKDEKGALVAHQTFVTLGAARGDQIQVLKGVKEGDEVVTAGQIKLRNGTPLVINNEVQPKNDANPKPEDK